MNFNREIAWRIDHKTHSFETDTMVHTTIDTWMEIKLVQCGGALSFLLLPAVCRHEMGGASLYQFFLTHIMIIVTIMIMMII